MNRTAITIPRRRPLLTATTKINPRYDAATTAITSSSSSSSSSLQQFCCSTTASTNRKRTHYDSTTTTTSSSTIEQQQRDILGLLELVPEQATKSIISTTKTTKKIGYDNRIPSLWRRKFTSSILPLSSSYWTSTNNEYSFHRTMYHQHHHQQPQQYCRSLFTNIDDHHGTSNNGSHRTQQQWDTAAIMDLFDNFAQYRGNGNGEVEKTLDITDLQNLLEQGIGKKPDPRTLEQLFYVTDIDGNGVIDLNEFIENAAVFLADSPARIILVIGGPGSGKGLLSERLQQECNVVHLSSGELLRQEVEQQTSMGNMVKDIMSRGELVSSALMVALMKKRLKDHPGKRVLLDGFPRSPQNAMDLIQFCGKPELALHLCCDDTILMERIMERGATASAATKTKDDSNLSDESCSTTGRREDDNFYAALKRLRTFHQFHGVTLEWLKNQHVPVINLDCSGSPESVWQQLIAIGRLMRPAVQVATSKAATTHPTTNGGNTTTTTTNGTTSTAQAK